MLSQSTQKTTLAALIVLGCFLMCVNANAQVQPDCDCYQVAPRVVYEQRPVTVSRVVPETVYETKKVTTYKPVWTTEKRERVRVSMKPVTKTSERTETYRVYRPVIETKYEQREVTETRYELATEMREETYRVRRPVVETEYRKQEVCVRKPVTETYYQTENVTTYKPINIRETALVPGVEYENRWVMDPRTRRLRWLPRGYYIDPTSGRVVYKKPGLHWAQDERLRLQTTARPVMNLREFDRTAYVPETTQRSHPVDITRYVDQIETREYPVQVQRMQDETRVVKVPVQVQRPVTRVRTEKIPYEQVTYRMEEHVRKVPVTEVDWERVEEVFPYEVRKCRWVAETSEVQVPRVVNRVRNFQMTETTPRRVVMKTPLDANGNPISSPLPLDQQIAQIETGSVPTYVLPLSQAVRVGETTKRSTSNKVPTLSSDEGTDSETDFDAEAADKAPTLDYYGTPIFVKERGSSILIKENQTSVEKPQTDLQRVLKPTLPDDESPENAADTNAAEETPAASQTNPNLQLNGPQESSDTDVDRRSTDDE